MPFIVLIAATCLIFLAVWSLSVPDSAFHDDVGGLAIAGLLAVLISPVLAAVDAIVMPAMSTVALPLTLYGLAVMVTSPVETAATLRLLRPALEAVHLKSCRDGAVARVARGCIQVAGLAK